MFKFISLLAVVTALILPGVDALNFANSKWIWTNEVSKGIAPVGHRAFRKDIATPADKTPFYADILITVDNGYTLYVNGEQLGTSDDWTHAQRYCAPLASCSNVIAIDAVNDLTTPNPAGVLVAAEITYTDGTTETLVSDASWVYNLTVPANFEQTLFDDSAWPSAVVEGNYGMSPWGAITSPPDTSVLSLAGADWIWTGEGLKAPAVSRAFRTTYTPPAGDAAVFARILMAADNIYSLYVNGISIGGGSDWTHAQLFTVPLNSSSEVVIGVTVQNTLVGAAGLVGAIEIVTANSCSSCGAMAVVVTNSTWKANSSVPAGYYLPGYDDSSWPAATNEGAYGVAPWGTITIP